MSYNNNLPLVLPPYWELMTFSSISEKSSAFEIEAKDEMDVEDNRVSDTANNGLQYYHNNDLKDPASNDYSFRATKHPQLAHLLPSESLHIYSDGKFDEIQQPLSFQSPMSRQGITQNDYQSSYRLIQQEMRIQAIEAIIKKTTFRENFQKDRLDNLNNIQFRTIAINLLKLRLSNLTPLLNWAFSYKANSIAPQTAFTKLSKELEKSFKNDNEIQSGLLTILLELENALPDEKGSLKNAIYKKITYACNHNKSLLIKK